MILILCAGIFIQETQAADSDLITVSGGTYSNGTISGSTTAKNYYITVSAQSVTFTIKSSSTDYDVKISGNISVTAGVDAGTIQVGTASYSVPIGTMTVPVNATVSSTSGLTIKITTAKTKNATISMTFTPTLDATSKVDVVFLLGDNGESYTVDGTSISAQTKIGVDDGGGIPVNAPAVNGMSCIGLMDTATNKLVSGLDTNGAGTFIPKEACTVKPYYVTTPSVAPYSVNGKSYYSWESAFLAAGLSYPVVVNTNYTLPSTYAANYLPGEGNYVTGTDGNLLYTIPTGMTLLIPYDKDNTLCTAKPNFHEDAYTAPSVYRTLTMADGANIAVKGALSVAGSQSSKYSYNGMPSGPLGFIKMNEESSITIESGGTLYAWGYITGSGSVEVKSTGIVYECFQIADYRGGDVTSNMVSGDNDWTGELGNASKYGVFPFNQYYLQNVEVPMKVNAGATVNGAGAVQVTLAGLQEMAVPFIGPSGSESMFVITDGYVIKDYIEGTGRTEINIYGNMTVSEVSMSLKVNLVGEITIATSEYALPIPNHMAISLETGSLQLNQSMAFLPGSELYMKQGTTVTLGSGKNIYVYDLDQWLYNNGANGYSGTTNLPYMQLKYVPGGNGTTGRLKDALVQVDGTVNATNGAVYVTEGGANIYSTGTGVVNLTPGTQTVVYQVITNNTDIADWPEITIAPAWLKNGDGSYVKTAEHTETTTYTYCSDCLKWLCDDTKHGTSVGHATNVELGNSLNVYFAFWSLSSDGIDLSNCQITVTYNGITSEKINVSSLDQVTVLDNPAYVYVVDGLAAKQMCDGITITLYNGETIVDEWADSIRNYAMRLLASADETYGILDTSDPDYDAKRTGLKNLRQLLVDMLNYGAACQTYFGYNTSDLANSQLTDAQKTYASTEVDWTDDSQMPSGSTNYPANLVTKSNIRFAINGVTASASYSFTDHWGDQQTGSFVLQAADGTDAAYYYIDKLTVADARQVITITAGSTSWTDSIEAYCKRMIDDDAAEAYVYEAFMKFSDSARTYLEGEGRLK